MAAPEPFVERCGKCARVRERGETRHVFEGERELVIDLPYDDALLPLEIVEAIREHEGLVRTVAWPETKIPAVREVVSGFLGVICPECYRASNWDFHQWAMFLIEHRPATEGDVSDGGA